MHTCPVCGQQTIELVYVTELQGDRPMTGWVTYCDEVKTHCACTLSDEQLDAIVEQHA